MLGVIKKIIVVLLGLSQGGVIIGAATRCHKPLMVLMYEDFALIDFFFAPPANNLLAGKDKPNAPYLDLIVTAQRD